MGLSKLLIDANGEELEFIKFLNALLPRKPELERMLKAAVERSAELLPFDMLILCVEHEEGVHLMLFPASGLSQAFVDRAREELLEKNVVFFPSWKEKLVVETVVPFDVPGPGDEIPGEEEVASKLFHKVEGTPNGFVQVFSGKSDAFDEKHDFLLGVLGRWLVSYFALAMIYERLETLAIMDPLTGVYNRRKFEQELSREIERSRRYRIELSLVILDVDNLRIINETYGHYAGDKVLQACARKILSTLRKVDVVTRIGGDEFVVIMPHTSPEGARIVCERMHKYIHEEPVAVGGRKIDACVTMCVTSFYPDDSFESIYSRVDSGLMEAKQINRGGFHVAKKE
ncbi:MAG: GGDEF domain-containing protein [Pseudomonadota bacterium]